MVGVRATRVPATKNRSKSIFYLFKNKQLNARTDHRHVAAAGTRTSAAFDHLINRAKAPSSKWRCGRRLTFGRLSGRLEKESDLALPEKPRSLRCLEQSAKPERTASPPQ
jgi:hypothetical protein